MNLGNRLYELRKKNNLTQDEVAEKLNVSRQTISKWETNQSQPDFDKILPICEIYAISTDELLTGIKEEKSVSLKNDKSQGRKTAIIVSSSVFLYFLAVIWVIIADFISLNESILVSIFLLIIAIGTVFLVYHFVSTEKIQNKEEKEKMKKQKEEIEKYDGLVALIFTFIYLLVSFLTQAWYITWLLWIVFAIVIEIIHILIGLKGGKNGK